MYVYGRYFSVNVYVIVEQIVVEAGSNSQGNFKIVPGQFRPTFLVTIRLVLNGFNQDHFINEERKPRYHIIEVPKHLHSTSVPFLSLSSFLELQHTTM